MIPPIRRENASVRNAFRNLIACSLNNMFPGAQRNTTSKDSLAFNESVDFQKSTVFVDISDKVIFGFTAAGE
jgi:hypothetical protein